MRKGATLRRASLSKTLPVLLPYGYNGNVKFLFFLSKIGRYRQSEKATGIQIAGIIDCKTNRNGL